MNEDIDNVILQAALSRKIRGDTIPWGAIVTDWFGLPQTPGNKRMIFEAVKRLTNLGLLKAEYNWHGIKSLEAPPDAITRDSFSLGKLDSLLDSNREGITLNLTINGDVGNLNNGTVIGNMEASFKVLSKTGHEDLEVELNKLIGAIQQSSDISSNLMNEVIQTLQVLSEQMAMPKEQRNKGVLTSALATLERGLSAVGSLASIWSVCGPLLKTYFDS